MSRRILVALLHLAASAKATAAGVEFAAVVAERMLQEPEEAPPGTNICVTDAGAQKDKGAAPCGTAPVLQTQETLVAGAGYNEERTAMELRLAV